MNTEKSMTYKIKEIFLTLQGEGYNTGKAAIFCRFSGCNLWNGITKNKNKAICSFCDTDFVGTNGINGGNYNLKQLMKKIDAMYKNSVEKRFIVFTGGEPLLQLDLPLINELKKYKYTIAIETNGTIMPPEGIDWICMSPKAEAKTILNYGNEIKVVYPQNKLSLKKFENLNFKHFYLQPMFNQNYEENVNKTLRFILKNPKWKLSLQTHKYLGIR